MMPRIWTALHVRDRLAVLGLTMTLPVHAGGFPAEPSLQIDPEIIALTIFTGDFPQAPALARGICEGYRMLLNQGTAGWGIRCWIGSQHDNPTRHAQAPDQLPDTPWLQQQIEGNARLVVMRVDQAEGGYQVRQAAYLEQSVQPFKSLILGRDQQNAPCAAGQDCQTAEGARLTGQQIGQTSLDRQAAMISGMHKVRIQLEIPAIRHYLAGLAEARAKLASQPWPGKLQEDTPAEKNVRVASTASKPVAPAVRPPTASAGVVAAQASAPSAAPAPMPQAPARPAVQIAVAASPPATPAVPCQLIDTDWQLSKGKCIKGLAQGAGEADNPARDWHFVGSFKNGHLARGAISQHGQPWFSGDFVAGLPQGKGRCEARLSPCEYAAGQRIDAGWLASEQQRQKQAAERQQAEQAQQQAEAALRRQERAQQRAEEAQQQLLQAIKDCQAIAERDTDANTEVTCQEDGTPYYNHHNRGLYNAFNAVIDAVQDSANAQIAERYARLDSTQQAHFSSLMAQYRNLQGLQTSQLTEEQVSHLEELQQQIDEKRQQVEQARQQVATARQSVQRLPAASTSAPAPARTSQLPPASKPVQWDATQPEAIAVCWQNDSGTKWFCDGPLQQTLVGENRREDVLKLTGCNDNLSAIMEVGASGRYQVMACGRGLRPRERDMRALRGVGGTNRLFRCTVAENQSGKPCTRLSSE